MGSKVTITWWKGGTFEVKGHKLPMGSKFTNWRWEELTPRPHKMRATWHNLVSITHHKPQQGGSGTKADWEVVRKMPTAQRNEFCQEHIMNKIGSHF